MTIFDNYEVWFVIGSQHLYGPQALIWVISSGVVPSGFSTSLHGSLASAFSAFTTCSAYAEHVVNALNAEAKLPCKLVLKPLGTTPDEITHINACGPYKCWLPITNHTS